MYILTTKLTVLDAPESTEVLYGVDNIISKTLKALSEVKDCLDGCWDTTGPSMLVTTEPVWKAVNELAKKGKRLRYITDITGDNISYCKMIAENGTQIRHLPGIKSNFGINDRIEYMATVVMQEKKPLWQAIVSNVQKFVEGQQTLFDTLWSKALPGEQRFREIEEGLRADFIETISDPSEIQKLAFEMLKSAKEEITILFSTIDAIKRQKHAGLLLLLQQLDPSIKVKILIPTSLSSENTIKNEFDNNERIEIRYILSSSLQTILTSLTVDRKFCLIVELKDDTKDNSYEAVRTATYSNSESIVWTHASIFETLWMQSEHVRSRGHK